MNGGYMVTNGAASEDTKLTFYWRPGVPQPWRFRVALALAKLAFWVWTR